MHHELWFTALLNKYFAAPAEWFLSLGGIHAALSASRTDHTFCLACDMPLVNPAVVAHLCALARGYEVVVPVTAAGFWTSAEAVAVFAATA